MYNNARILLSQDKPVSILAVEDDELSMVFLQAHVTALGHSIHKATDGAKACDYLRAHYRDVDVILMDREMPVMDGLTAVRTIKQDKNLRNIPVIMVTGADSLKDMQEGLDAGVFYYLAKPVEGQMLRSVLNAAIREARQTQILEQELGQHRNSFEMMQAAKFTFSTLAQAESLAAFLTNCFPEPHRTLPGLGALLVNAVEHGNLGLGYEAKTELIEAGTWRAELERLQQTELHAHKQATATLARKDDGIYIVIDDAGEGFDWRRFLTIDPSRAGDSHGRGIAQAKALSFDKLSYNEAGNQAAGFVSYTTRLQW